MGFPLEELTEFKNGRVRKIYSKNANGQNKEDESSLTTSGASTDDAEAILAALAGPLPYIRRGAWGKKWKQVEHETQQLYSYSRNITKKFCKKKQQQFYLIKIQKRKKKY